LAEDALFCHKCGKPQREDLIEREAAQAQAALPPPVPPAMMAPVLPPIGFHNGLAVRIGLSYGLLSILILVVSGKTGSPAPFMVWLVASGFLAVMAYRRRTGQKISWLHGARLGWISGIFGFASFALLIGMLVAMLSDPTVVQTMRSMKFSPDQEAQMNQALEMLHSGPEKLILVLLQSFLMFTILPACGGALGVKLLDRD
jgi:hypothetical protein